MNAKKIHENFLELMGAPVVTVEITESQAKIAFDDAKKAFQLYGAFTGKPDATEAVENIWVEKYAYASLKETLGHIRGKFKGDVSTPNKDTKLEYESLFRTGWNEKQDLKNLILF